MADAETTIYTLLTGNVNVTQAVNKRVYPLILPQNAIYPAITYQRVSSSPENTLAGYSGLMNPYVSISSWATSYSAAKALANDVHTAMNGSTMKNVLFNEMDNYDPDEKIYFITQDYSIWNVE
jgi:hypothetical protein